MRFVVPNWEKPPAGCLSCSQKLGCELESVILCASETMHHYVSVTVTPLLGPWPHGTLQTSESCFQTQIIPPTGCLSLKRSWNKSWWMSAFPSRRPGSLQLPINKDFGFPVRSSAIYTPKRKRLSLLNTDVKWPGLMEDTLGGGNVTIQSYSKRSLDSKQL